jgi:hypothetical protein
LTRLSTDKRERLATNLGRFVSMNFQPVLEDFGMVTRANSVDERIGDLA